MSAVRRSIDRLPSGRWRARFVDPTTGRWTSTGSHHTKALAAASLDLAVGAVVAGTHAPAERSALTFDEYATQKFWPSDDIAETTRRDQLTIYRNHVAPRWGDVRLADIDIEAVEHWGRAELPKRLTVSGKKVIGASMQRQAYWIFHKIVAKAVERQYIARSPLPRKSGLTNKQPTKPTRILQPDEIERLARAVDAKDPSMIFAAAYGGFRCGELLALRFGDLDFENRLVSVDEQVSVADGSIAIVPNLKRARSHRAVPLPPRVMAMLALRTMGWTDPTALLFPDANGGPLDPANWRRRVFHPAVSAAGLPHMVPHDLRHTAASVWFDEGTDIVSVARLLGDSLAVAERTYVHLFSGKHDELMAKLDRRVAKGAGEATPARRGRSTSQPTRRRRQARTARRH